MATMAGPNHSYCSYKIALARDAVERPPIFLQYLKFTLVGCFGSKGGTLPSANRFRLSKQTPLELLF